MNHLVHEKSPYLRQHVNNPVDWYSWSEEALSLAKSQNKPIFLSIGYSTCYWCHVMEHDSFEQNDVAKLLNENFISIKVDREERPDVDKIYMDAVVALTGHGGWPMSVFLTPEGKPFFGGTFFPRVQFLTLLNRVQEIWKSQQSEVTASAENLRNILSDSNILPSNISSLENLEHEAYEELQNSFDKRDGGFGAAPKFPHNLAISLLLRFSLRKDFPDAKGMALHSLKKMAFGGIYDHLGGGFHRYSTDREWRIPHFEKMLYDNALLAWTSLEAFQVTGESCFRSVAQDTLEYLLRDMRHDEGGFFAAEDAGEVGEEGDFYVWKFSELQQALSPDEFLLLQEVFSLSEQGNFEHGKNIFCLRSEKTWEQREAAFSSSREKLLRLRGTRQRPRRDEKIITSWNGLCISAFCKGYQVLGEEKFLDAALRAAHFIKTSLWKDGKLFRRWCDGEAKFNGGLDDYAFLIDSLINLYESSFDEQWIAWAEELQARQDRIFLDAEDGTYFYNDPSDKTLFLTRKDFRDGAEPCGNSLSLQNLARLFLLTLDARYQKAAEKLSTGIASNIKNYPSTYATYLMANDFLRERGKQIVLAGEFEQLAMRSLLQKLYREFLPNKVLAFASSGKETNLAITGGKIPIDGQPQIYLCSGQTCLPPVKTVDEIKNLL